MKVLHAPSNLAGQATIISAALRDLGIESDVIVFDRHPFGYEGERSLDLGKMWIGGKIAAMISNFVRCIFRYDLFHLHFGRSLLPRNIDLPLLRLMGRRVIMQYWGSEVRQRDISLNYIYSNIEDLESIYARMSDLDIRKKINFIDRYACKTIVGDYSLKPYSPKSIVIKQAIDLGKWNYVGAKERADRIKVVHAPSNRQVKGTKYIVSAINRLKNEGLNLDFVLLEHMSNKEVREHCRDADIVVDQLLIESYGIFAIECMAMGKPVLCRIDQHFAECYPDLPILNTNPESIYENLKMLAEDPKLREQLGKRGRRFVEEIHDSAKIAGQLADLYRSI